jgi:hypothetical protein
MNSNNELTTSSLARRRYRHWYMLGLSGVAVGLLTAVGLASFKKVREASAKTK